VTVPPRAWFHGICYRLFEIYRQALVDLGCALLEIPIDIFAPPDAGRISVLLDDIRAFSPQLAIGLHNGATALHCRLPAGRDGWQPQLFTDVLDLPTICIWDHAPLELADQLLTPLPQHPAQSKAGAGAALRRAFTHPRLLHCARDSGQVRIMRELGLVAGGAVVHLPAQAFPDFAPPREPFAAAGAPAVCFIGHIYNEAPAPLPELEALEERILQHWSESRGTPLWDVANRCIAALPSAARASLALDRDQTFFWRFVHRLIDHRAQTRRRLEMLGAAGTQVGYYGNLGSNAPNLPRNLLPLSEEEIAFGPPLADVFARHAITIDVLSPGFVDGYSLKPINGFAAGGFVLVDRKRDFLAAFGEAGAAVSYLDGNDLAAKVDYFLGHPKERAELAGEMRALIEASHGVDRFFARLLDAAHEHFGHGSPPRWPAEVEAASEREKVTDLLSSVRTQPFWPDAQVDHDAERVTVTTSSRAWAYAAEIPVPSPTQGAARRMMRLTLTVEVGRLGIAPLVRDTSELLGEQYVGVTRAPVSLAFELPELEPVTIILRSAIDVPTRATILRAELREDVPAARTQ